MGSRKVNMDACTGAVYSHGAILCKAGLNKGAPLPIKIRKEMGDKPETFVKIDITEAWFCKAVTGKTTAKHTSIKRASLLSNLLKQYIAPALDVCPDQDEDNDQEEVVAAPVNDDIDDDPMNEIDTVVAKPVVTGQRMGKLPKKFCRSRKPGTGRILKIEMPKKCPDAFPDCAEKCIVTVFVHDKRTVWLHIDDVNWAIQYMYAQNVLKGVAHVPSDSVGPATP